MLKILIQILIVDSSQIARGVSPFIPQCLAWQLKEKIMQFSTEICRDLFQKVRLSFHRELVLEMFHNFTVSVDELKNT